MAYEYEDKLLDYASGSKTYEEYKAMSQELQEVYRKARAFDEIVIETTGAIMNCPPGAVETEAGRLTLDIIEKYDLEDK